MLAEKKKRLKWSLNPRGNFWSHDTNKYGQQMLEKMGWKPGCGLGANEQGITEQIKVAYKNDKKCIGYKEHGEEWLEQQSQFENLLAELGSSHNTAVSDVGNESLELRSRQSRARVHYHKFTRGKDISNYTDKDLACILGVKKPNVISDCSNFKERKNDMDTSIGKVDNLYGITTVNGGNMSDYFIKKKHINVDDAPAKNRADTKKEQLGPEYGMNECEAEIKTKKKQKHKNTESPTIQKKKVDEQVTKNELSLDTESIDGVNARKKKRKLQEGTKEEYLLKVDEKSDEETYIKQYSKEDACNLVQEIQTRGKHKVSPNINVKEFQQETGGDEMNDTGSSLNYKRKKRKLEKERKEHLIVEEETVKQDERMSVMESCNEKDMYRCELEDSKTKRKKKQKDCPDAQEKEVEAERNDMAVLNNITSSTYKKRKRKSKQDTSIDRSTEEADNREMKDHKPMEEENIKHKVKKKKKSKCSNDGNIHDIQEHKHIQHNLEETPTDSCNSGKCDELSVIGETSASVNCKNAEEKEKRKKRKRLNKICAGVELKCKKDEILQEQVDTEMNQDELNTATQNDIQNVEGSEQARSKYKQKQDILNSDVQNSDGANIKINDLVNRDLNIRNMKPSMFAKLVDPSLVRFRGSNLCKIVGYGCN